MFKNIFSLLIATVLVSAAIAQPAKTATEYYNDGVKLKEGEKYKEALVSFKNAGSKKPDYYEAWYEAGWCANELEQYTEAATYLEKAKKLSPSQAKIYFELAYAQDNSDKTDDAILNYKKVLELYPEYYSALQNLGDIYYKKEDYSKALDYYKQYLQGDDIDNYYYYKAGWSSNDLEAYGDAINYLEKYEPTENDDIAKKYAEIGYANYKLENNDESIDAYKKALDAKPGYGTALRGLGNVYYNNTEDYDAAIDYFEQAIEKDEENSKDDYYKLGWLYNDAEQYDDAINILLKAVDYDEKDPGNREELGYAYYMKDNYENALTQLNKAIELDPKSKLGYYYKGLCYLAQDKKDAAMNVYTKLKEIDAAQAEKLLAKINGK